MNFTQIKKVHNVKYIHNIKPYRIYLTISYYYAETRKHFYITPVILNLHRKRKKICTLRVGNCPGKFSQLFSFLPDPK